MRKFIVYLLLPLLNWLAQAQNDSTADVSGQHYRIGYFSSPPLSFVDPETRQANGLIVDLMNQMALEYGFTIEWVHDEWPVLLEKTKTHEIDMITSAGYNESRATYLDFAVESFVTVWGQVFIPNDSTVENIFDLDNKTIAALKGDINAINLLNQCKQFDVTCHIREVNDYSQIFDLIQNQEVDGGVSNNLVGLEYVKNTTILGSAVVFNPFKAFVAIPKGQDPALLSIYNQTIANWKEDSDSYYYQSRIKWLQTETETVVPAWAWPVLLFIAIIALLSTILATLFKKQVKMRVKELSGREEQLKQIVNLVPHMIYVVDINGDVVLANETASHFFGLTNKAFEDINSDRLLETRPEYEPFFNNQILLNPRNSQPIHKEFTVNDFSGTEHVLYLSRMPFWGRHDELPAILTVGVDITEAKKFEDRIKFMAQHDALTDLPNRLLLDDRLTLSLDRAIQHNHNGAILFLDIDNFKTINDSQGHRVGDLMIKEMANRLDAIIGKGDTLARLGGDEFIIELAELGQSVEEAEQATQAICQKILDSMLDAFEIDGRQFHITSSIGAVIYPKDGDNQNLLIQRADTAMYEAKGKGGNQVVFFRNRLEQAVIKSHELENDLRKALEHDQMRLLYQPIIRSQDGQRVGAEALMRWLHPSKGWIQPNDFIPIAEKSHLILELGYWALEQACIQIQIWKKDSDDDLFIAVNLSVIQIRDDDFLEKVTALVHKYKIPRNHLEIEVTESVLMRETQRSIRILKELKQLGIRISIDDFGTGYSSFNYIRKLPLDKIKIDQSFIKDIPDDRNSTTIVKTIFSMAKEMNFEVVAEGVETQEQIQFLTEAHCQYFQGYYFGKPQTADEFLQSSKEAKTINH